MGTPIINFLCRTELTFSFIDSSFTLGNEWRVEGNYLGDEANEHEVKLEPQDVLEGPPEEEADVEDLPGERDHEGEGGQELAD